MARRVRNGLTVAALGVIWAIRLVADVVAFGVVNRAPMMAAGIMLFLGLGLLIVAAKISAPFIYTLF